MIFPNHQSALHRRGTTLLEVLLATVILALSLAALTQHSFVGATASLRAEQETEAALRCASLLSLLLADRDMIQDLQSGNLEDDPAWRWEATYRSSAFPRTKRLTVRVWSSKSGQQFATSTLTRLIATHSDQPNGEVQGRRRAL